jgi:hypothetical protein
MLLRRILQTLLPVVALFPAALLLACPGKESGSGGAAGTSSTAVTTAPPTVSSSATTAAIDSATTSASASASVAATDPSASASASSSAGTTAMAGADAGAKPAQTCGDKPLPACPLKAWMQGNSGPAMADKDFAKLVPIFNRIATMGPPGYPNWASISHDGANAATAQDLDGTKAACRSCHDQYKKKFKADYAVRSRKI